MKKIRPRCGHPGVLIDLQRAGLVCELHAPEPVAQRNRDLLHAMALADSPTLLLAGRQVELSRRLGDAVAIQDDGDDPF